MVLFKGSQLPGLKQTSLWGKVFGDMLEENSPGNEGDVLISVLLVLLNSRDAVREVI